MLMITVIQYYKTITSQKEDGVHINSVRTEQNVDKW